MSRSPRRAPGARGEAALFADPRDARRRTERAADAYVTARRVAGTPLDPLAAALLREAARDRDLATLARDPDVMPRITRALLEVYREIRAGEADAGDGFADELAALLAPADSDTPPG